MASIDPAQFPHLSAEHRSVLTRMAQALGDQVALDVLSASPEQQIFRLEQFENFSNAQRLEGERTTSLSSAAAAPQTQTPQTPRPRAVKFDAPKFDGADGDKLIHWLLAVECCAKAQLIDSNEQMVSFAISNLRGRASEWAFSTLLADECAFDTWDAVSTREKSVSQTSSLIVLKVHVDGIATPLRALVDTGASNNFVRNEVIVRHGVFVPDANEEKTMIVRLANGSTVKMLKRVVRLAIKCEDFRGEDEFILLDLDDKFDLILGMPWLKRYQPSIDWMKMKISVDKSRDVDLCCTTTDEVVWVYTSVEEIPDDPCDIAVCDGPPCSQAVPILKKTNGGGAVRRQKKTVSFAIDDEKVRDGVDKSEWKRNRHPSQDKKTSKRSFSPRVLSSPDQGTSGDDEGSVQAQDIPSEFVNIAVYNEECDVDVIRHVKIENPPSSVEELISLPSMSKKTLERSLARGDIAQVCAIVETADEGFVNTASSADVLDEKTRKERFEEQSWDAFKKNPVRTAIVPQMVKQLRQWLGLANYLHKYTRNYAALVQPLTRLLKKDVEWKWSRDHQTAFEEVKRSLREAPALALPNHDKSFHVVCGASDYAIGCALMQHDDEGHERVVSYQPRQLRPAERNYPVHDKELLAMKYSLVKFRVYLLGEERFAIYTDHASLRTAVKTPHLSQRMARWFSFFAEYNFVVHYKPGKTNILADALSRRPDYDPKTKSEDTDGACRLCEDVQAIAVQATTTVREEIVEGYKSDETCQDLLKYFKDPSDKALQGLPSRTRSRVHRFRVHNGLLYYAVEQGDTARVVVPNDEGLRHRLLYEYHDNPSGGHLGREKTFLSLSRDYYWPHMYKWVRKYVRTCEICQRVKPSGSTQAPLRSLAVPSDSWKSVSMDFIFGLPRDKHGRNGILVFVDRFSKMVHLAPVSDKISAEMAAKVFVDVVFRLHGLPVEIVSDRDTRFTSKFWRALFGLLDTKLSMSTAAHPETDGQTERVNRVLEDVLRSYATSFKEWSEFLPLAEFALNNSTHVSTGHSPFYVNYGVHPRVPASIMGEVSTLSGGGTPAHGNKLKSSYDLNAASELKANFDSMKPLDGLTSREEQQVDDFVVRRQAVVRFVRDAIAKAQDLQKEQADKSGRKNKQVVQLGKLEASTKVHWTVQGSEMQW
ncbi:Pol protein, partial [Globisporangium splendens]